MFIGFLFVMVVLFIIVFRNRPKNRITVHHGCPSVWRPGDRDDEAEENALAEEEWVALHASHHGFDHDDDEEDEDRDVDDLDDDDEDGYDLYDDYDSYDDDDDGYDD